RGLLSVHVEPMSDDLIGVVGAGAAIQSGEQLVLANLEFQHRIDALRSSTVSMGFGYIRRRCTSNAKHSSATSLGRERDRPVCFSIRRNRWRTVLGWQISTSAAPRTDASLFSHTRNVSNSVSRSSSGRSPKPSSAA